MTTDKSISSSSGKKTVKKVNMSMGLVPLLSLLKGKSKAGHNAPTKITTGNRKSSSSGIEKDQDSILSFANTPQVHQGGQMENMVVDTKKLSKILSDTLNDLEDW